MPMLRLATHRRRPRDCRALSRRFCYTCRKDTNMYAYRCCESSICLVGRTECRVEVVARLVCTSSRIAWNLTAHCSAPHFIQEYSRSKACYNTAKSCRVAPRKYLAIARDRACSGRSLRDSPSQQVPCRCNCLVLFSC